MAVRIQLGADDGVGADDCAGAAQKVAFAVVIAVGHHGAVQAEQGDIHLARAAQVFKQLVAQRFVGVAGGDPRRGGAGIVERDAHIAQRMARREIADHRLPYAAEALRGGDDADRHRALQGCRLQQDFQVARGEHAHQHRSARELHRGASFESIVEGFHAQPLTSCGSAWAGRTDRRTSAPDPSPSVPPADRGWHHARRCPGLPGGG
ncbi:hypothetical protein G6F59_014769 [Rhizopus arrhizus]|nr:hypothetical protein G6F59_014769 [Rhizopus arrhizus]